MALAAGILSTEDFVLGLSSTPLVHFRLSVDRLGPTDLLESCNSTPGRYLAEIFYRLQEQFPCADAYLGFNPFVQVPADVADQVQYLADRLDLQDGPSWIFVHADTKQPLAYLVTAEQLQRCPRVHFSFLTTSDSSLDQRFLAASFGVCNVVAVPAQCGWLAFASGYYALPTNPACLAATRHATELLAHAPSDSVRADWLLNTQRVAVLSWHAGDQLFLVQALALEKTPFTAVLVLEEYADIVRHLAPHLECIVVSAPIPGRGSFAVADETALQWQHVEQFLASGASPHRLFHLLRPGLRDYAQTRHHLREATAFAIGGRGHSLRPLPKLTAQGGENFAVYRPIPRRILLQFDAGWALKGYPRSARSELIDLLLEYGFEPVLLGAPEPSHPHIRSVEYGSLAQFRVVLGSSEAFIGCDSFPAHFANQVGHPTLTLFGSTHPDNSRPTETRHARALHNPLTCVPCGRPTECHQFGGERCHAHARPHEVLKALQDLLGSQRAARPWPLSDGIELSTTLLSQVTFPAGATSSDAARERFIDDLFRQVRFEELSRCPLCQQSELRLVGERFKLPVVECQSCQLWFIQRRIVEADLGILYSERYWVEFMSLHEYPTYAERYYYDYAASIERVLDVSRAVAPGSSVLDIGCGAGSFLRRLAEYGYPSSGLELDAKMAAKSSLLSGIPVYNAIAQVIASGARFDLITGFDVFEHIYDPVAYLHQIKSMSQPQGALMIETFRTDSPQFQSAGLLHEDVKPIEHPYMYRQSHITGILERAGMRVERISYPLGPEHARTRIVARWT